MRSKRVNKVFERHRRKLSGDSGRTNGHHLHTGTSAGTRNRVEVALVGSVVDLAVKAVACWAKLVRLVAKAAVMVAVETEEAKEKACSGALWEAMMAVQEVRSAAERIRNVPHVRSNHRSRCQGCSRNSRFPGRHRRNRNRSDTCKCLRRDNPEVGVAATAENVAGDTCDRRRRRQSWPVLHWEERYCFLNSAVHSLHNLFQAHRSHMPSLNRRRHCVEKFCSHMRRCQKSGVGVI